MWQQRMLLMKQRWIQEVGESQIQNEAPAENNNGGLEFSALSDEIGF